MIRRIMRHLTFALILSLSTALVAPAAMAEGECRGPGGIAAPVDVQPSSPGDFRFVPAKGLGCVVPEEAALAMGRNDSPVTFLACLKIGDINVSDDLGDVEEKLGEPARIVALSDVAEARAYFLPQRGKVRPYYVVTYRLGKVVGVQLVGPPAVMPYSLSGVGLGDDMARVVALLGPPVQRCDGPAGMESWLWPPLPIGIDFRDGKVAAMKVTWPH